MNKVVARFADGRILKGMTADFFPNKDLFHVSPADEPPGTRPTEVHVSELKALFFVKDYAGNPEHNERNEFPGAPIGRPIKVIFKDGEVLVGTTQGYQPNRPGFFLEPADPESNIERCFVITGATREVGFI